MKIVNARKKISSLYKMPLYVATMGYVAMMGLATVGNSALAQKNETITENTITKNNITVSHVKIRMAKTGMGTGAFMMIKNNANTSDVLLKASTTIAKRTEVHLTSITSDGMAKMEQQKQGVTIPANGELVLKHGSYHVMLMGLQQNVKQSPVAITLTFKNAGDITVHAQPFSPHMKMKNTHKNNKNHQ